MKKSKSPLTLTTILPVHNEASHLAATVSRLLQDPEFGYQHIVLIENGSRDDSAAIAREIARQNPHRVSLIELAEADLGQALHAGLSSCCQNSNWNSDWIHINGADLPFGTSDLKAFREVVLATPADVILGSKFHPESRVERSWLRSLASLVLGVLRRILTGMPYRDTQGTLFLRARDGAIVLSEIHARGFFYTTELTYRLHQRGLRIVEVPVELQSEKRPSSVRVFRQSWIFLRELVRLKGW